MVERRPRGRRPNTPTRGRLARVSAVKRLFVVMVLAFGLVAAGCASDEALVTVGDYELSRDAAAEILGTNVFAPSDFPIEQYTAALVEYAAYRNQMQTRNVELNDDHQALAEVFIALQGGPPVDETSEAYRVTRATTAAQLALLYGIAELPVPTGSASDIDTQLRVDLDTLSLAFDEIGADLVPTGGVSIDPRLGTWSPELGQVLAPDASQAAS